MSTLTGQQINLTYPGLLNLETSTTGITSNPQQIQDGLGNNTGIKIATNYLTAPNVLGIQIYSIRKPTCRIQSKYYYRTTFLR